MMWPHETGGEQSIQVGPAAQDAAKTGKAFWVLSVLNLRLPQSRMPCTVVGKRRLNAECPLKSQRGHPSVAVEPSGSPRQSWDSRMPSVGERGGVLIPPGVTSVQLQTGHRGAGARSWCNRLNSVGMEGARVNQAHKEQEWGREDGDRL